MVSLPVISKTSNQYPKPYLASKEWLHQFHEVGPLQVSADRFSSEPVSYNLHVSTENNTELLLFEALLVVVVWNSYRAKDADELKSIHVTKKKSTNSTMRNFEFKLEKTKVITRQEAITNHAHVTNNIMCSCDKHLRSQEKVQELRNFLRNMKSNPDTPCISRLCPYGVISEYVSAIPDASDKPDLKFFRALSSRGNPRSFIASNLGINKI
jgi:hypothetical protein